MLHALLGQSQQGLLGFRKCSVLQVLFYLCICYFSSVGKLTTKKKVSKMHLSRPSIVWGFINVVVMRDASSFKHSEWEYVKAWKLLKVSLNWLFFKLFLHGCEAVIRYLWQRCFVSITLKVEVWRQTHSCCRTLVWGAEAPDSTEHRTWSLLGLGRTKACKR